MGRLSRLKTRFQAQEMGNELLEVNQTIIYVILIGYTCIFGLCSLCDDSLMSHDASGFSQALPEAAVPVVECFPHQ
jgi:hypothetical protein